MKQIENIGQEVDVLTDVTKPDMVDAETMIDELDGGDEEKEKKIKADTERYKSYGFFTDGQAKDLAILRNKPKLKKRESEYKTSLELQRQKASKAIVAKLLSDEDKIIENAYKKDIKQENKNAEQKDWKYKPLIVSNIDNIQKSEDLREYFKRIGATNKSVFAKVDNKWYSLEINSSTYTQACDKEPLKRNNSEEAIATIGRELALKQIDSQIMPRKSIK